MGKVGCPHEIKDDMKRYDLGSEQDRRENLKACLRLLAGAYPQSTFTETTPQAYWIALENFSTDVVRKAFEKAIKESEFFPPPARIRRIACSLQDEQMRETRSTKIDIVPALTPEQSAEIKEQWLQLRNRWQAKMSVVQ